MKNKLILILVVAAVAIILSLQVANPFVNQGGATCYSEGANNWCEFKGYVDGLYVNDSGVVIATFSDSLSSESLNKVGLLDVKSKNRARFELKESIHSEMLDMLKLSFEKRKSIKVHTHGSESGYLKLDHIWIYK
jgi:hypothetical protein